MKTQSQSPQSLTDSCTHSKLQLKMDEIVKIHDTRVQAIDHPQKYPECLEYPLN